MSRTNGGTPLTDHRDRRITELREANDALRVMVQQLKAQRRELRAEVQRLRTRLTVHEDKARGDYWCWQGDGEDHLESLTCPVLIAADQLRDILASTREAGDAVCEVCGRRAGMVDAERSRFGEPDISPETPVGELVQCPECGLLACPDCLCERECCEAAEAKETK